MTDLNKLADRVEAGAVANSEIHKWCLENEYPGHKFTPISDLRLDDDGFWGKEWRPQW